MPTFRWLPTAWATAHQASIVSPCDGESAHYIVVGALQRAGEDRGRGIVAAIAAGFAPPSSGVPTNAKTLRRFRLELPAQA